MKKSSGGPAQPWNMGQTPRFGGYGQPTQPSLTRAGSGLPSGQEAAAGYLAQRCPNGTPDTPSGNMTGQHLPSPDAPGFYQQVTGQQLPDYSQFMDQGMSRFQARRAAIRQAGTHPALAFLMQN